MSTCLVLLFLARFNMVCGPFEPFLHAGAMKCATWGEWSKSSNRNMMWIMIAQLIEVDQSFHVDLLTRLTRLTQQLYLAGIFY